MFNGKLNTISLLLLARKQVYSKHSTLAQQSLGLEEGFIYIAYTSH
jgi:hypothetical protein